MSGSTCKFCGEKDLEWDHDYHSRTGRWRLQRHNGCNKPTLKYGKDRRPACRWNGQKVCDMSASWERHVAKI